MFDHFVALRDRGDPFIRRIERKPNSVELTIEVVDGKLSTYVITESKESSS